MFVSRSRHDSEVKLLLLSAEQREAMYQNHVRALEARIEDLKRLVFMPSMAEPLPVAREADAIITPVNDTPLDGEWSDEDLREQNRILSGEYETVEES